MPDQPVDQWPPEPLPERIVAAETLEQLRNNLRTRVAYVVEVLGFKASMVATSASLSEKGLAGYDKPSWNPTSQTMRTLDETLERFLPTWIEDARHRRDKENGA